MRALTKCFITILFYSAVANCQGNPIVGDSIPYGQWKIFKYQLGNNPVGLSDKQIRSMIGRLIVLKMKKTIVVNDTCNAPVFSFHQETEQYLADTYLVKRYALGIKKNKVNIYNLSCGTDVRYRSQASPNFSYEFIVISNAEMIVNIMGVFFYLKK